MTMTMNQNRRKYTLLLLLICCFHFGFGQTSSPRQDYYDSDLQPKQFDHSAWEDLRGNLDYEETDRNQTDDPINEQEQAKAENLRATVAKILIIAGIIAVVVLLLRRLTGGRQITSSKSSPASIAGNMEVQGAEELDFTNDRLRGLIREAVLKQDFRLATRLYYLTILQQLSIGNLIAWQKQKTNRDYANEIKHTNFFRDFLSVTNNFERIWYGREPLPKEAFNKVEEQFKNLSDKITDQRRDSLPG